MSAWPLLLPVRAARRRVGVTALACAICLLATAPAAAQERLCDAAYENCRSPLLDLIRNEQVGIDAAWWFMTDARYTNELIRKWQEGVPIRVIVDTRANASQPFNADRLRELKDAGIPMRQKVSSGILHWKAMIFAGQNTVQFSAANYSPQAFVPIDPYKNYTDEVIYFTTQSSLVHSFMTKFDDLWTTTSGYSDYANVTSRVRHYPTFPKDPELNFPPKESFRSRSVQAYKNETQQIDAVMFRITDRAHTDALIAALGRGVRVRIISDWGQYTWTSRLWHAWNIERLYMAGAEIRMAGEVGDRSAPARKGHWGTMHQKSTLLYGQGMTIFGSSNWTSPSTDSQEEHNYFTTRPLFFQYFRDQFERKWNNSNPLGAIETEPLELLPPDPQALVAPDDGATGLSTTSVTFRWLAGYWTHVYDLHLGTDSNPPAVVVNRELGPSQHATDYKTLSVASLQPGTTYYWRVVGKTMAGLSRSSSIRTFTTEGTASPPPPSGVLPDGWASQDIGAVGRAGSAVESGGTFTVKGAGGDIWDAADAFHFAYRSLSGDGEIIARVGSLQGPHHWTKAGVMIRESLLPGSRHAMMLVSTGRGLAFQRRVQSGGISTNTDGGAGTAPVWVRLVRSGNRIDAYRSSNGSAWTLVGTETITMGSTVHVGLALTSHDTSSLATAAFDNVLIAGGSSTPPPPPPPLPSGWANRDIGAVGRSGTASESGGTFTVQGGGADIWGTADGFHFAYRSLSGDGEIIARVASVQGSHHWTKAGVMIRESLSAGSRHAMMLVSTGRGLALQRRVQTDDISTHTDGGSGTAPVWVRLVRSGNRIDAYQSSNGSSWTLVGTETITMSSTVHVGLALTSHDTSTLATATFDNVQVVQGPASTEPPPSPLPDTWSSNDVGSVGAAGTALESDGLYTIQGAGADIWGTADAFHFAYREIEGDGRVEARVTRLDDTHRWAKAGVMIRESLAAGSRHAMMLVSSTMGMAFQRRAATGGESVSTAGTASDVPRWVALERSGDALHAFESADGVEWTLVGSDIIPMDDAVYVGLAVTSHAHGVLTTATFDNVSVN